MNIELFKQALAKIGSPNILVNVISKRVRQLNSTGSISRPYVSETSNMSALDIALREVAEDKLSYDVPVLPDMLTGVGNRKRRKV